MKRNVFSLLALLAALPGLAACGAKATPGPRSCTVFAAAYDDTVLFANNEDYVNPNTYYWVVPSSDGNYGGVYVGVVTCLT